MCVRFVRGGAATGGGDHGAQSVRRAGELLGGGALRRGGAGAQRGGDARDEGGARCQDRIDDVLDLAGGGGGWGVRGGGRREGQRAHKENAGGVARAQRVWSVRGEGQRVWLLRGEGHSVSGY
jgi:hypothetical protein